MLRGRAIAPGSVGIRDGRIVEGGSGPRHAVPPGWTICAGFVDVQVNGFGGAEVGGDPDELAAVARALPAAGVTAFCPTLVSRSPDDYARAARALRAARLAPGAARPLGVHLEGPFLAPTRHGAHDRGALVAPSPEAVDRLMAAFSPSIVTLAPELPGGLAAIRRIRRRGCVVAVGHTEADAATGRAAIAAGAGLLTHALQRDARHREPRPVGPRRVPGAPPRPRLADRRRGARRARDRRGGRPRRRPQARPDQRRLRGRGGPSRRLPPGLAHDRLGRPARAGGGAPRGERRRASTRGPATLVGAGIRRAAALAAAVESPRRLLGLPPGLSVGGPADIVVLDPDLVPRLTLIGGHVAFADPELPFYP